MKGVVAGGNEWTARAGATIFRSGGNAVDAAVAAAFASFVAETGVVNIGGGGFATVVDAGGRAGVYDFFSTVPSKKAHAQIDFAEVFVNFGSEQQAFHVGRASTATPGVVAGLCRMAQERGSLPLSTLLQPAIDLAADGFTVSPMFAYILKLLEPIFTRTPQMVAQFKRHGRLLQEGDRIQYEALAETLRKIARHGSDVFHRGELAAAMARDQAANGGLLTLADLENYRVETREPVSVDYRDFRVLLPPPCSFGGLLIGFALKLLESVSLAGVAYQSFEHLNLLANVMRLANIARKTLEDESIPAEKRFNHFLLPQHVRPYQEQLRQVLAGGPVPASPPEKGGMGSTSHISVMDGLGNAISITTSAGEGAGYLVEDTGICLNNMLGEEDLNPHGFHADPPGTRLRSMMSPAIVLRDGHPVLSVGSAGSNRLRSAIIQTISGVLDFKLSPHDAINNPRIHFESGILQMEEGLPSRVVQQLRDTGFRINIWEGRNLFFGGAQAVSKIGDTLQGAADSRRHGAVAVVEG